MARNLWIVSLSYYLILIDFKCELVNYKVYIVWHCYKPLYAWFIGMFSPYFIWVIYIHTIFVLLISIWLCMYCSYRKIIAWRSSFPWCLPPHLTFENNVFLFYTSTIHCPPLSIQCNILRYISVIGIGI